ncbi:MAG: M20/M25/M40 family metallo-hydrolase [Gemmatimonadales bacterium]
MIKRLMLLATLGAALPIGLAAQQATVDTAGVGAVVDQATNHSQVMAILQHLSDVIGPRLTGSAAVKQANDWGMAQFKSWGLSSHLDPWTFAGTFWRGPSTCKVTTPFVRKINCDSWAWTAGTGGRMLAGRVVQINAASAESLAAYRGKVRGAWVLLNDPATLWNPDGPPMTAADSAAMRTAREARTEAFRAQRADTSEATRKARQQFAFDRPYLLRQMGALGQLYDGSKDFDLMTMSGSPNRPSVFPNVVIGHEDYAMLWRQLHLGLSPHFAASIDNKVTIKPTTQWNTVAEIKGSEKPGEVVILGGHLDSWDLGQGSTDNGAGAATVLEAARAIAASGVKPKRTIRFILFTGEEEGLLGSAAYANEHAADADSIQAVLVLDNGTGRITGQALQGRPQDNQLWQDIFAPLSALGPFTVRDGNKGGTDHLSFLPWGVPSWNFDQESRGYNHTHHSQVDTYDHAVGPDLVQASSVMAATALELANLPELLPRGVKVPLPDFGTSPMKPSPGLDRPMRTGTGKKK